MLACSVHCNLYFSLLVIKSTLIFLKMQLHPHIKQQMDLNFLNICQLNMWERRFNNDAKYHIKYLMNYMDMIHFFGGTQYCVTFSGNWIFDRNIFLHFLSLLTGWNNVAILERKKMNGYKVLLKFIRVFLAKKYVFFQK